MLTQHSLPEHWQRSSRDEYWKLPDNNRLTINELTKILERRKRRVPVSWKKSAIVRLKDSLDRGFLRYETCSIAELRSFCIRRKIPIQDLKKARKHEWIAILEAADEKKQVSRLYDLPPELRVQIYIYYFKSLPRLDEPVQQPILRTSSLIRREALPLFYSTCFFRFTSAIKFFDNICRAHLDSIRNVTFEYCHRPGSEVIILWQKGKADVSQMNSLKVPVPSAFLAVLRYLKAINNRPVYKGLLKADVEKLFDLLSE